MSTVKLVALTQPLVKGINTADEFVAYAAKVSNPNNQLNTETAPRLIKYLINNAHWSPFEVVSVTMEINTTRDISRQILRHRSFSFQEFSQRYAKSTGFTTREARLQDNKNRQNSVAIDNEDETQRRLAEDFRMKQIVLLNQARELYDWALDHNIAKEQARVVLPEGLTETTLYMAGTLRSWIHYIDLRSDNGTQLEHRLVALQAKEALLEHFPTLKEYFNEDF